MNRLWFADDSTWRVYYLPLQQKTGELKYLPLNAMFRRGGTIRAMYTWTIDGGAGMDDQLVIFTDQWRGCASTAAPIPTPISRWSASSASIRR